MPENKIGGVIGALFGGLGFGMSTTQLTEILSLISISIGILVAIVPVIVKGVKNIVVKIKKAKEDGKITKEEIEEIHNDAKNLVSDIKSTIEKKNNKSEDK